MASDRTANVDALVDRGLDRYGRGDILGALLAWEQARVLDPRDGRADHYIDLVRQSFDLLEEHYSYAREAAERGGPDGSGEESVTREFAPPPAPMFERKGRAPTFHEEEEGGWWLGELTNPPIPDGAQLEASDVFAGGLGDEPLELVPDAEHDLTGSTEDAPHLDERPTMPIMAINPSILDYGVMGPQKVRKPGDSIGEAVSLEELGLDDGGQVESELEEVTGRRKHHAQVERAAGIGGMDDDVTMERGSVGGDLDMFDPDAFGQLGTGPGPAAGIGGSPPEEPYAQIDFDVDFHDDPVTAERPSMAARARPEPPRQNAAVIVDDTLMSSAPRNEPAITDPVKLQAKVTSLLHRAKLAADEGRHDSAVAAAEEAFGLDPEGRAAPVVLHRHRDLLIRIYEEYLGDLRRVPVLMASVREVSLENLDHRAGFLISRIDGSLSYEDILDVSGMPRLDAYRILSQLQRRQLIRRS